MVKEKRVGGGRWGKAGPDPGGRAQRLLSGNEKKYDPAFRGAYRVVRNGVSFEWSRWDCGDIIEFADAERIRNECGDRFGIRALVLAGAIEPVKEE